MADTTIHPNFRVTIYDDQILAVTLTRSSKLNSIDTITSKAIAAIWTQLDDTPSLRCGIITGSGRAFCVGADLHEWNSMVTSGTTNSMAAPGLAGLCRRSGKKPIIAAVNGLALGGGFEMLANCDIIVAHEGAEFGLPEVRRGIVPVAGCLPRLVRTIGLQRTLDLALTGRRVDAATLRDWGLISRLTKGDVLETALGVAREMCANSPDALLVARRGARLAWEGGGVEGAVDALLEDGYGALIRTENFAEGIRAFVEKREPVWRESKL